MSTGNTRASGSAWPFIMAVGIAIALVGSINVLWWRLARQANAQVDVVDHTHQVIIALEEVLSLSADMVVGQRGFALTRDPEYVQPFSIATNRLPAVLSSLRELTQDNLTQKRHLAQLEPLLARHEQMSRQHLEMMLKSDPLGPDLEFRRMVKESLDAIRSVTDAMIGEENRLLVERRTVLRQDTRRVTWANVVSGVVSAGLLLGVFRVLWRENVKRRRIEAELRRSQETLEERVQERTVSLSRSEERLRLAQQAARIGTFEWSAATGKETWTPELEAMHGLPPGGFARTIEAWEQLVHPDDRAEAAARMRHALETGLPTEGEWRVVWPDGSVHWLFGRWQAFQDESGRPQTMTGVNIDITERKRLEREIIEAGDSEMRRIGHDLHDGVGQQLTALALFNASLQKELQAQAPRFVAASTRMGSELHQIIRQIRVLSHGLAPISFEDNGLADALRKLAGDTSSIANVHCEFEELAMAPVNDPQTAAQLYRIGQEAVTNALKHAGATKIQIVLESMTGRTELRVSDNGRGFPQKPGEQGLGLRAMKYRADLIGATLQVDSGSGTGTRVTCILQK